VTINTRPFMAASGAATFASADYGLFRVNETWADLDEHAVFERMRRAMEELE
jgi:hypothetical protein